MYDSEVPAAMTRTGNLEVDRLVLGRFGTGSGVLLRGTSGRSTV